MKSLGIEPGSGEPPHRPLCHKEAWTDRKTCDKVSLSRGELYIHKTTCDGLWRKWNVTKSYFNNEHPMFPSDFNHGIWKKTFKKDRVVVGRGWASKQKWALPQFDLYNKTSQQKPYYGFEKKSFDFIKTSQTVGLLLKKTTVLEQLLSMLNFTNSSVQL